MIGFHRLHGHLHRYCCLWDCPLTMTIVFASSWCYQDKATGIGPTFTVHRQTSFFFHVPYLYSTKTTNTSQNMMEIATVEPPKLMNRSNRPFLPVKHPRPKKHPSMVVTERCDHQSSPPRGLSFLNSPFFPSFPFPFLLVMNSHYWSGLPAGRWKNSIVDIVWNSELQNYVQIHSFRMLFAYYKTMHWKSIFGGIKGSPFTDAAWYDVYRVPRIGIISGLDIPPTFSDRTALYFCQNCPTYRTLLLPLWRLSVFKVFWWIDRA